MNLELLDPFGRPVPDRIDATLSLPAALHHRITTANATALRQLQQQLGGDDTLTSKDRGRSPTSQQQQQSLLALRPDYKAANIVAFARRGNYIATGYGSGTVAIHNMSSRQVNALYRNSDGNSSSIDNITKINNSSSEKIKSKKGSSNNTGAASNVSQSTTNGVTSLSWSRRSRTLLVGAAGDSCIRLWDTTHHYGPDEYTQALLTIDNATEDSNNIITDNNNKNNTIADELQSKSNNIDEDINKNKSSINDSLNTSEHGSVGGSATKATSSNNANTNNITLAVPPPEHRPTNNDHYFQSIKEERLKQFFIDSESRYKFTREVRSVESIHLEMGQSIENNNSDPAVVDINQPGLVRYPAVSITLSGKLAGSLQIHPRIPTLGLAVLTNGVLQIFSVPNTAFYGKEINKSNDNNVDDTCQDENNNFSTKNQSQATSMSTANTPVVPNAVAHIVTLWKDSEKHIVTCAAFDPHGRYVYAATDDGTLLGWNVQLLCTVLQQSQSHSTTASNNKINNAQIPSLKPSFHISMPGSGTAWHIIVSRNGRFVVVNSSDGSLRLYISDDLWNLSNQDGNTKTTTTTPTNIKTTPAKSTSSIVSLPPLYTFQDLVNRVKFASCDLSGDGEFLVGGANGMDNKYELYIWNTQTGTLLDRLKGCLTLLYSVAWHPTRSFLAVACADGLVDIWGPRIQWTAYAPDFQALHKNIEYIEREDEFDVDSDGNYLADKDLNESTKQKEETKVDVLSIDPVPVFASDSEDETEVFDFAVRLTNRRMREQQGKRDLDD